MSDPTAELPHAFGGPAGGGRLRAEAEEFFVEELPDFTPDGGGEHALLWIEKRNVNTEWLARQLARLAGVKPVDVGFAGLKDRAAVTRQWFSVHLGNRPEPDWSELERGSEEGEAVRVLRLERHGRKLRRGDLEGNRFRIVVRDFDGDRGAAEERLAALAARGLPNYFGEQRFGRDGGNLVEAEAMLLQGRRVRERHLRGLYLSAARSWLFNRVLAERVRRGDWERLLPGEVAIVAASRSSLTLAAPDEELQRRAVALELHPSGPLWGRGRPPAIGVARQVEEAALAGLEGWRLGLEHAGLNQERRPLRVAAAELEWDFDGPGRLTLCFRLPAGSYATSLLREVVRTA